MAKNESSVNDKNYIKHTSKGDWNRMKRTAILAGEPKPVSRGVSPHPQMQEHIRIMQDTDTNRRSNGGSYSKKKYGRTPGTTKKSLSPRGKATRITYNYIMKEDIKRACLRYINTTAKYDEHDLTKLKELRERDIKKVMNALPNTTVLLDSFTMVTIRGGIQRRRDTVTFTSDMFKRNIANHI